MNDKEKLRKAFNLRGGKMSDEEKLEAIQKLVTTYPMNLQDTIKEIQKSGKEKKRKQV